MRPQSWGGPIATPPNPTPLGSTQHLWLLTQVQHKDRNGWAGRVITMCNIFIPNLNLPYLSIRLEVNPILTQKLKKGLEVRLVGQLLGIDLTQIQPFFFLGSVHPNPTISNSDYKCWLKPNFYFYFYFIYIRHQPESSNTRSGLGSGSIAGRVRNSHPVQAGLVTNIAYGKQHPVIVTMISYKETF